MWINATWSGAVGGSITAYRYDSATLSHLVWRQLHLPTPLPNMPRYWEILEIADAAINTLKEIGVEDCCFIGGMACKLYTRGTGRQPKVRYCGDSETCMWHPHVH